MDTNPKYIVWKTPTGPDAFIIFSNFIKHDQMALMLNVFPEYIKGAGFVNDWFECYGESISLKKKSRIEEDTTLIRKCFKYEK